MRAINTCLILVAAALLLAAVPAGAQVPTTMNYQVMLTDNADLALVDTAVQVVFRLYTDPLVGSLEWTETHNTQTNHIGVVSVVLGETTPLDPTDFDQPLWLEVEIGGETMTPRRELTSAAFALRAHDSDYLGGVLASEYALSSGTGDGHSLDASDGSPINQVYVAADGNVGIGTTSPNEDIHVHDATGLVYQRFTNSTTGTGTGDGFKIGINGAGNAYIHQYEAESLFFSTSGIYRGQFDSDGTFELGNNLTSGYFELYLGGSTDPIVFMGNNGGGGGEAEFYDSAGLRHTFIEPDIDGGGGGFLGVNDDGSGYDGIFLDGNHLGSGDASLSVTGSGSTSRFNAGEAGDDAVVLPTSAINATEMFNEPGAAGAYDTGSFALTGAIDILESRTIVCPGPGYVLAIATGEAWCDGGGSSDAANFGVSTSSSALPSGGAIYVRVPDGSGTGTWFQSVTVHGLFETPGGSDVFYFLADLVIGDWTVSDRKLSLIYIPTAYGTVTPTMLAPAGDPETDVPEAGRPLTEADLAFEHSESIAANQARIDAELAAMRTEMAELKAELRAQNGSGN
ncbi:MAG: hypothetical protein ABIG03_02425 [Candidatus Eisenbacteria bacterium]